MFQNILGGFVDKEKIIKGYIQDSLHDLAEELKCDHTKLCVIIKPINSDMDFEFLLCSFSNEKGVSKPIRKIKLSEIISDEEKDK